MTMESVAPEQVLKQGQLISITARSGCCTLKLCGTIRVLSHQALTVSLAVSDREFLLVPSAGADADCAIIGNGCVYHFASTARSASALPLKIWYLERPPVVYRVQQRRFVRVPLALPMQVRLPGAHGSLHNPADTMLVDISGGGLCFASASEVPPGSRIALDIPDLPLYGPLQTTALVRRCTAVAIQSGTVFHVGASLEDSLTIRQQDKLIQSIFRMQRDYLEKGLRIPNIHHIPARKFRRFR